MGNQRQWKRGTGRGAGGLSCRELRQVLGAWPPAELPRAAQAAIEAHLGHCDASIQGLRGEQDSREFYRLFQAVRARSSVKDAVMAKLPGRGARDGRRDKTSPGQKACRRTLGNGDTAPD